MKTDSLLEADSPIKVELDSSSIDFGEKVYSHINSLYSFVIRRVGSASLAEELVAETCHSALVSRKKARNKDIYLWMLGIARRKISNAYRDRRRRREISLTTPLVETHCDSSLSPEELAIENESIMRLRQLVLRLPDDQREALLLQHLEQLSQAETAEVMGKSVQSVNSLQQRARANLQKWGCGYFDNDYQGGPK